MNDFDKNHDVDGTLDDEYFFDHYGKQPINSGNGGCLGGVLLIIIGGLLFNISPGLGFIIMAVAIIGSIF